MICVCDVCLCVFQQFLHTCRSRRPRAVLHCRMEIAGALKSPHAEISAQAKRILKAVVSPYDYLKVVVSSFY